MEKGRLGHGLAIAAIAVAGATVLATILYALAVVFFGIVP